MCARRSRVKFCTLKMHNAKLRNHLKGTSVAKTSKPWQKLLLVYYYWYQHIIFGADRRQRVVPSVFAYRGLQRGTLDSGCTENLHCKRASGRHLVFEKQRERLSWVFSVSKMARYVKNYPPLAHQDEAWMIRQGSYTGRSKPTLIKQWTCLQLKILLENSELKKGKETQWYVWAALIDIGLSSQIWGSGWALVFSVICPFF